METLSIIVAGFGILFFLGVILAGALPPQAGTWDYATGGMPKTFTLWMIGIGISGFLPGCLLLYFLGAFDESVTKYKKLEIEVPESIKVDVRFYQDSQDIHREFL